MSEQTDPDLGASILERLDKMRGQVAGQTVLEQTAHAGATVYELGGGHYRVYPTGGGSLTYRADEAEITTAGALILLEAAHPVAMFGAGHWLVCEPAPTPTDEPPPRPRSSSSCPDCSALYRHPKLHGCKNPWHLQYPPW